MMGAKRGDGARAQIVAIGESARQHREIRPHRQLVRAVPDDLDLHARLLERPRDVALAIGARKQQDRGFRMPEHLGSRNFDQRVGEQLLASLAQPRLGRLASNAFKFDLEHLALTNAGEAFQAEQTSAPSIAFALGDRARSASK